MVFFAISPPSTSHICHFTHRANSDGHMAVTQAVLAHMRAHMSMRRARVWCMRCASVCLVIRAGAALQGREASREEALTAQMAFGGYEMLCQGAGCMSGTSTGGPCAGMSGLHSCMELVPLVLPRALCTLCNRAVASGEADPRCSRLLRAASLLVQSICACCLAAEAVPSSTPRSAQRSMVPLHGRSCGVTCLSC